MARTIKAMIEQSSIGYSVYIDDDTLGYGLIGEGATVKEAVEDFYLCYQDMKDCYEKQNKPFEEVEFDFYFDIASFLQKYAFAFTLAGLERITGVNQKQLGHYINGVSKPSKRTILKIEDGLKKFSSELASVRFA